MTSLTFVSTQDSELQINRHPLRRAVAHAIGEFAPILALVPALTLVLTTLVLAAAPVSAGALDDARKAGQVGEQANGYVALVNPDATAAVKALVQDINARRKTKYAELSKENNVPIAAIESQMGEKLIQNAAGGTYVQNAAGQWTKK
jgi:uncharacterized protein YdbL (DUF1318 family)